MYNIEKIQVATSNVCTSTTTAYTMIKICYYTANISDSKYK
jgi:hypothetical protein